MSIYFSCFSIFIFSIFFLSPFFPNSPFTQTEITVTINDDKGEKPPDTQLVAALKTMQQSAMTRAKSPPIPLEIVLRTVHQNPIP